MNMLKKVNPYWFFVLTFVFGLLIIFSISNETTKHTEDIPKPTWYKELPASKEHPQGLVELSLNERKYRIPKEYCIVGSKGQLVPYNFELTLPRLNPIQDKSSSRACDFDRVIIKPGSTSRKKNNVTDDKLEKFIVGRHQKPVKLKEIPGLLEYPSKGTFPHYRAEDNSTRWADGLPTYFYCGGGVISQGYNYSYAPSNHHCFIELSWDDGVLMNIEFNKRHIRDWKRIHDDIVKWFESHRVVEQSK